MQKNLTFIVLSILIALSFAPVISAKTDVASPSPVATPSINQVVDSLKERIKDGLSTPNASQATIDTTTYRAFVGIIKDVIQKTIILETKDGKKQVVVNDDTTLLRSPGNQTIKLENVRIDDYLIAIGTLKEEDILEGHRLITSSTPITDNTKLTGYGQITEIKGKALTLTSSGDDQTITINDKTIIKSRDKSGLSIGDLPLNSRVIYTAEKDDDTTIATVLMLIQ